MDRSELRKKTGIIIRKDGEYLVGTILYSLDLRWGISTYDAWITRNVKDAIRVAKVVGGELMLFNPIVGQLREYRGEV